MQLTFSTADITSGQHTSSKQLILGLHKLNNPAEVTPIQACLLQHDSANTLLQAVFTVLNAQDTSSTKLSAFDPTTNQGFLRQLILRRNSSNEVMVVISTSSHQPQLLKPLITALCKCDVPLLSIVNTVIPIPPVGSPCSKRIPRRRKAQQARKQQQQERSYVLHGSPAIIEQMCGLTFHISPESFFQVNSAQAEVLYRLVQKAAGMPCHSALASCPALAFCLAPAFCACPRPLHSPPLPMTQANHLVYFNRKSRQARFLVSWASGHEATGCLHVCQCAEYRLLCFQSVCTDHAKVSGLHASASPYLG